MSAPEAPRPDVVDTGPAGASAAGESELASGDRGNPYAGISVVVMAVGLSASLSVSLVLSVLQTTPISQQLAGVLSTLGGAVVGSIATYLGVRGHHE
ncbi:hypothetical protein [Mycobacteroides abscessus]|uniref:hypothetical protein n=1 Tax=Mycobacteroides abscessus TaxID=36809 RepID=UPI0012FFD45A|nr:hypothetical protein [Mycobacteroides abscessus]